MDLYIGFNMSDVLYLRRCLNLPKIVSYCHIIPQINGSTGLHENGLRTEMSVQCYTTCNSFKTIFLHLI